MQHVDMEGFAGGALSEQFNLSLLQVIENMLDTNTPFKPKRKISMEIEFEQNEDRDDVGISIKCTAKTVQSKPQLTHFKIGKDLRTGKIEAQEYGAPMLPNNYKAVVDA